MGFFFSSRRRHTRWTGDWSSDVCSSDLNDDAHRELARQLQRRIMTRKYRAIVVGEVPDPAARIEAPVGRDPKHRQRMAVVSGGREALTEFQRLGVAAGHSLLEV